MNERFAALLKIDAIARPVVNAQFTDAFTYRGHVARISNDQTLQPNGDCRLGPSVFQLLVPLPKGGCLLQDCHGH